MNDVMARKADLAKAEDKAIFGDGDLAAVRASIAECDSNIALIEKAIEGAEKRRIAAAKAEALTELEAVAADAKAKGEALGKHYRRVYELVEELRGELFRVDALANSINGANATLEANGRQTINLSAVRRLSMAGPRASMPARLSPWGVKADKALLQFLSSGGIIDRRATAAPPVDAVESNSRFHSQMLNREGSA
ncbi:hypothetical protein [Mesorhizobium sp. PL10]